MTESAQRHSFQAEVQTLLDLMVHSLYSNKDVFLRELVSNASDALDKLRFERLTKPDLGGGGGGELSIRLEVDAAARTLTVSDNGIGMSRDEVVKNIGTIARSGTKEFLATLKKGAAAGKEAPPDLIGQFGVGFYSAFMVASKVELLTRRAGEESATHWESTGDGTYEVREASRDGCGTTLTLHLKPADPEHGTKDYTQGHVLSEIVKHYSDFVAYPIRLKGFKKSDSSSETQVKVDETLNSMKAIWDRPKGEVSDEEYREFYRHISHDWTDPLRTIPAKMEGTLEAYALLYLPANAPWDLYSPEMKRGVQLYVKRVFVMDECRELLPAYLRFVKGVVDAHDLPLNVSREILQKDRQIQIIKKHLVKKVLGTLEEMRDDKRDEYVAFFEQFGPVLKEGLVAYDVPDKDKLLELLIAPTSADTAKPVTLKEYASKMKDGQESIYFLTGGSIEHLAKSPLLEGFTAKGYEVLLFADPVDELWLERPPSFGGKALVSIGRGDIKLGTKEEQSQASAKLEEEKKELGDLLSCFRVHLQNEVKEVRLSSRLTTSPACIVTDEHDPSQRMQKVLERLGQTPAKAKPVLELNPKHAVVAKLLSMFQANKEDPRLKAYAELLLGQAHLSDTGQLPNPEAFREALSQVMLAG